MGQFSKGTMAVTNGGQNFVITGASIDEIDDAVSVGDLIRVNNENVLYEVGSVSGYTLTATALYTGATASGLAYSVTKDFTPNYGFPELSPGDVGTAEIYTRAMRAIDSQMKAIEDRVAALE